jgi:hypothetical protein
MKPKLTLSRSSIYSSPYSVFRSSLSFLQCATLYSILLSTPLGHCSLCPPFYPTLHSIISTCKLFSISMLSSVLSHSSLSSVYPLSDLTFHCRLCTLSFLLYSSFFPSFSLPFSSLCPPFFSSIRPLYLLIVRVLRLLPYLKLLAFVFPSLLP